MSSVPLPMLPLEDSVMGRAADRARIANINLQILELKRSLSALRREKRLAQERLASYAYPVLTLPNEITSEIFLHFIPVYPLHPSIKGLLSPTLLTHICRQWRNTALTTPALWRSISVESVDHDSDLENSIRLKLWMTRSRSLPVSICFRRNLYKRCYSPQLYISALIPHRARWEYLELKWMPEEFGASSFLSGPMPSLREIKFSWEDKPSSVVFVDAPLLRSVDLHCFADAVNLPFAQLTSLTLTSVEPFECTPILQRTRNLVHCALTLYPSDDNPPQPEIELHILESLIFVEDAIFTDYAETFIVPALRILEIPDGFLGEDPLRSLASLISKSGCQIQELRITGTRLITKTSYREAFPSIPKLTFDLDSESEDEVSDAKTDSTSESEP
ncbi:hypothetical protein C8R43DRAFT_1032164 [Mycena crocata]|nr:hypothetical protein C8R43DRAFT_1032164 [Mycena crocata]